MSNQPGFNGTRKIIDISGSDGTTDLVATGPVRSVSIEESPLKADGTDNTLQGFQYQLPNDGFTQWLEQTVVEIGDPQALRGPYGIVLGNAADTPSAGTPATAATVLAKLRSATATATSVLVTQYY